MTQKRVKLLTQHAEFPESKFPGGILTVDFNEATNEYTSENVNGVSVVLDARWIEPEHDENFEATYQKAIKEARLVFDAAQAKAVENRRLSVEMAEKIELEKEKQAKAEAEAEVQRKRDADKKAQADKIAADQVKEDLRQEEIGKNRVKAQALADTKSVVEKEISAESEKVDELNLEVANARQAVSDFHAAESKQGPEYVAEYDKLVNEVETKKTFLDNALADLRAKKAELKALSELRD